MSVSSGNQGAPTFIDAVGSFTRRQAVTQLAVTARGEMETLKASRKLRLTKRSAHRDAQGAIRLLQG